MSIADKKLKLIIRSFIFIIAFAGIILYSLQKNNASQYTILYDGTVFTPEFIVIHLGSSVNIKNISQASMEIAVGRHENHRNLNGFQEKIIDPGLEYIFTPLEKGVFDMHDHLNPKKLGYLVIDK